MNNSNPFVPQGSLLEQMNKKRARFKVAVYSIFAVTIAVLTPLLIQGCSKKDTGTQDLSQANNTQPADTGSSMPAPAPDTNNVAPPPLPPVSSNATPMVASNPVVPAPQPPVTPPVSPATPDVPAAKEYVVSKGDSFYSIAKKFGVKIKDIQAANPTVVPAKLKVGQKLEIPAGGSGTGSTGATADAGSDNVYVVKAGDSLTKIAKANGITVKALRAANELKTDKIKVGEKLKLPAKAAPAAPTDTAAAVPPVTTTAATSAPVTTPIPAAPAPGATGTASH